MRTLKLCTIFTLLFCLTWPGNESPRAVANDEPNQLRKPRAIENFRIKAFMRKKLVAADQIMEGLTTPDVALVKKGATTMIHMNKQAMWASFKSPAYAQDSADFVRSAERLIKLSKATDLEGASHTYAQLTIQCVNCHRRVRNQAVARSDRASVESVALRH